MPVYLLRDTIEFPPAEHAEDGLLAVGGDLRPERILRAYCEGIFPWYEEGQPILWHSPDPRCVFDVGQFRPGRTLRKFLSRCALTCTFDTHFSEVIARCQSAVRGNQPGTWITDAMHAAYCDLHELGFAHSVEVWRGDELQGGLYGVSIGRMFFGESMWSGEPNASKVALCFLMKHLRQWGFRYVDSQVGNDHTLSLGAVLWTRADYLTMLRTELAAAPTRRGRWSLPHEPASDL